jgi:outer membrane cobalamin receptor
MSKKYYCLIAFAFLCNATNAQTLKGFVGDNSKEPVIGATIYWTNAPSKGVATDIDGQFVIPTIKGEKMLVISAVGFTTDSVAVNSTDFLKITLSESSETLNEVVVKGQSILLDRLNPIQTETITTKALAKAACCNLSESFETNASVSVNMGDAVTGAKQLSFLGLSGRYVQTTFEGIPSIRGLESTFGLLYVPGTWIQAIDISKGVGSVITGYESLSGGINIELMKPGNSEKFYLNTYVNSLGRAEINVNATHKINEKWSVGLLTHGSTMRVNIDRNGDDFLDAPKYSQVNILNRWKYQSTRLYSQFGFKYVNDDRTGGQTNFVSRGETPFAYGFTNSTNRAEVYSKTAILFPDAPYRGLALILNAAKHNSDSYFGNRRYKATQDYGYGNLVYQDKFGTTMHTYKTGMSFVYDDYDEQFGPISLQRRELVPGAFFEYTYNFLDKTILVLGARTDFHNLYGVQFTPRMHFKHDISEDLTFRASAGSGFRVPNRLVEYYGNLVSNRQVVFTNALQPEKSWNYGVSLTKTIGKSSLVVDFYRTDFVNKLIGDVEHPEYLYFYNSNGVAFANAFQIEYNWVPSDRWEAKLAYRFLDSKQTMGTPFDESVLLPVMFQSPSRVLFNVGYSLPYDKWKADLTVNWNGKGRIPTTDLDYDHTSYESMPFDESPSFFTVNAQVTRTFVDWEYYAGGENLTNFKQANPIVDPFNPAGNRFDAGMNWGPIVGRILYLGMRYRIR